MHSNISFTEQTRELFISKGEKTNMRIEACYIQIKHLRIKSADQTLKCSAWVGRKFSHDPGLSPGFLAEWWKWPILELISPVPHDSIQTHTSFSRDLLLRVVPP